MQAHTHMSYVPSLMHYQAHYQGRRSLTRDDQAQATLKLGRV